MKSRISLFILACLLGLSGAAQAAGADVGRTAYTNNCAGCHGTLTSSWGVGAQAIQSAIQRNKGGMGRLASLSAADLQDIAAYMADPAASSTATTGTTTGSSTSAATGTATSTTGTGATGSTSAGDAGAVASNADVDRLYDWAERTYPQFFNSHGISQDSNGYYTRYYPGTNVYLASRDGQLYFIDGNRYEGMLGLGRIVDWLKQAGLASGTTPPASTSDAGKRDGDDGRESHGEREGRDDDDRDDDADESRHGGRDDD